MAVTRAPKQGGGWGPHIAIWAPFSDPIETQRPIPLRPVQANTGRFRRNVTPVNTQMRGRGHRIGQKTGRKGKKGAI